MRKGLALIALCLLSCGAVLSPDEKAPEISAMASCSTDADCASTCELCVSGTCSGVAAMGTVCRKTAGGVPTTDGTSASAICDPVEICDGTTSGAGSCPANAFAAVGTNCGQQLAFGPCDVPDKCNAMGRCIARKPIGTVCKSTNPSNPICDPQDLCDGLRILCPTTYAPPRTPCGPGQSCDNFGRCL